MVARVVRINGQEGLGGSLQLIFNTTEKLGHFKVVTRDTTCDITDGRSKFLERFMKYALKGKMQMQMYYAGIEYRCMNVAAAVTTELDGAKWLSVTKLGFACPVYRQEEPMTFTTTDYVLERLRFIISCAQAGKPQYHHKAVEMGGLGDKRVIYRWHNSEFEKTTDYNP
eukprot:GHVS01083101.1.p1 GENE.GHVS01083101.1~~GHVS01083101.1.p1  ORF type:complete len:169 (+),score=14.25 GHVS01083101.1:193-699(+)